MNSAMESAIEPLEHSSARPLTINPNYWIYPDGQIWKRGVGGGKNLKWTTTSGFWPVVHLKDPDGGYRQVGVQLLVWEAFIGPMPKNSWVRPKDGNKRNVRVENLIAVPANKRVNQHWTPSARPKLTERKEILLDAIAQVVAHERTVNTATLPNDPTVLREQLRRQHEMILELALVANDYRWGIEARRCATGTDEAGANDLSE